MAKYSTGGSAGGGDGDACELCGATDGSLVEATVAGARLMVCPACRPHGDASGGRGSQGSEERSRRKRAARNTARARDAVGGDSSRWEREGTDYDDDPLPYLVPGYDDVVVEARQAAGYGLSELSAELAVREADLLAVEQGRAARAHVGGSVIAALEEHLGIELAEE